MNPQSISDWLRLCEQHERAAYSIAQDKRAAGQALFHAGISVECALKAYIWHNQRFNQWPDKKSRPDLYTHDLRALKALAQISVLHGHPTAPSWHVVLQWDRNQGYDPNPMPRKVAASFIEAAYGKDGVVTWLRQNLPTK